MPPIEMPPIPMVRANAVVPFVTFLEGVGAPAERLLERVRLSPRSLEDEERLLPLPQCLAFVEYAARAEKSTDLGLLVGLQTRFDDLGAVSCLIRGTSTLHEALNRLIGAMALHYSGEFVWLDVEGGQALFCHRFKFRGAPGQRHGELFTVAMIIDAIRAALGSRWMPDEVRLSQA